MTGEFDSLRAIHEELESVAGVRAVISRQRRDAEHRLGLAEAELNAFAKMDGWLRIKHEELLRQLSIEEEKLKR